MVHRITPVEANLADLLCKYYTKETRTGFVKVDGYLFTKTYEKFADAIENFKVRDDDIWVCSFPKAGTTWTQEMVWCIANDLDFERAKVPLSERFPFFETASLSDFVEFTRQNPDVELPLQVIDSIRFTAGLPSPRFIKTHLPFELLPRQLRTHEKKAKIIHVARNAKDSCISYYHHAKLFDGFNGSFEDFCKHFIGNMVIYTPFWKNVLSYQKKQNDENVLLINYEDMKKDLASVIKKTAGFLGKNLTTDQLSALTEHLSFASMKNNRAVNYEDFIPVVQRINNFTKPGNFMRNGNIDQWKTDMSPEENNRFDNWTRENLEAITYATFWKHVVDYWNKRDNDNVLFLIYDDMQKDLPLVIQKTGAFLGKNLSNDQVSALAEYLSFSNMKANLAMNNEQHMNEVQKIIQIKQQGLFM